MFCTGIFNAWNLFEAIINQVRAAKTSVWFSLVTISIFPCVKTETIARTILHPEVLQIILITTKYINLAK